jgi:hypothetical protein
MPGWAFEAVVFLEPLDLLSPCVGVGQRFLRAIVSSDGLIGPTLPMPPPWFVP